MLRLGLLRSCSLLLLAAAKASAVTNLNVQVYNSSGAAIPGATVVAIHFSSNGPSAAATQLAVADSAGLAQFSAANANQLLDNLDYEILATTQGFLPSIRGQFNDPLHPHVFSVPPSIAGVTIHLSSSGASGLGEIDADVSNATANSLVFGSIKLSAGSFTDSIAYGLVQTGAGGGGRVKIFNVPYSATNTYKVEAYDQIKNKSASNPVDSELAAYRPLILNPGTGILDFNAGIPPITYVNQAQQSGNSGNLSVDGVVTDTNSANAVPYLGFNFQGQYINTVTSTTVTDFRWANTDTNGRFQLYGLIPGVTYYSQINGACGFNGTCYQGFYSTALTAGYGSAPGINDFLFASSSTVQLSRIKLNIASGGTGTMAVYVKDSSGNPIPHAFVNLFPDALPWETSGTCAGNAHASNPGLANTNQQATTGYALLTQLPSGNYIVGAGNPFNSQGGQSRLNDGPDGQPCYQTGSCQCGTDDLRVTVDTTSVPSIKIFNSSGVQVGTALSSITVTVPIATNNSGRVQGTLNFPQGGIDLSADPINITLQTQCTGQGPCSSGGNYAYFNSPATGPVINYSIAVASGQAYWMNITSNYWGVIQNGGQNQVDLTSASVVTVNLQFARAGRLKGKLYKPDGSLFQPTNSQGGGGASIQANGNNSYAFTNVNQDGSFIVGGLLPGPYNVKVQGYGTNFTYTNRLPTPVATITLLQDTYQDVYMVNGDAVRIDVATTTLPPLPSVVCPFGNGGKDCPPENWAVKAFPSGTILDQTAVVKMLTHDSSIFDFPFVANPGTFHGECNNTPSQPGWCVNRLPAPSNFDFYLLRQGDFDEQGLANPPGRPYLVILNSARNTVVNDLLTNVPYVLSNATISVRPVNLTPVPSLAGTARARLQGSVIAQNLIRQQDFNSLGGDFDKFLKFIPLTSLYDSNNVLKAVGMVVPIPACFQGLLTIGTTTQTRDAWLNQTIASGDFPTFQTVFNGCPGGFGYDIRGISSGTYTAVITSPNYPPCQNTAALLVDGSTVTLNFNLDTCAGAGAALTGVVSSTNGAVIPNASVSAESPGYPLRSIPTDSSGTYRFDGLPPGSYKIKVVASGYALVVGAVDVSGTGTFTRNFTLRSGGASITGTVYAQKVPFVQVQPGAQVVAYNDTLNVNSPSTDLALYKTVTSSAGVYRLDGLEVGSVYKIFVKVDGKYVLSQATMTIAGTVSGIDFSLLSKPLDVQVFGHPAPPNFEFTVLNPADFKSGRAWVGPSPFVVAAATEVSNSFQQLPNNQLLLQYSLSNLNPNVDYVLHIEAVSAADGSTVTRELVFGTNRRANSRSAIDGTLLGDDSPDATGNKGNESHLDSSGSNPSAITLPVGALIPVSSASVPVVQFTNTDVSTASLAALSLIGVLNTTAPFASGIYKVLLSSINYTEKGFDLTLAYDKANSDPGDLAIYHFNDASRKWEAVPGLQTLDPIRGTITVRRLKSLASVLGLKSSSPLRASSNGQTYSPSAYRAQGLIPDDSGSFAVLRPSLIGNTFAGTTIKVFNFPNPFNLQNKTLALANAPGVAPSITTTGTVIKYELPQGTNGHVYIRIYTLAGELVRELDQGDQSGGFYYYTAWDGKNRNGSDVANGVYYGILSAPGAKAKDATFKMAVIK